jgi:regulation of enolase protein 1 (concanavalin A-like superfamily)
MTQDSPISIPGIPAPMHWRGTPPKWSLDSNNRLTFSAGPRTDWFIDPNSTASVLNAPSLLTALKGPFTLKAIVSVDAKDDFDAGTLVVYQSDKVWAKVCLELSPQKQLMIVSVVTRDTSDDCNSVPISGNSVYMRLAKLEQAYAFHYSLDGRWWNLVRHFGLGHSPDSEIGFIVQSPRGNGCTASFSEIEYLPQVLKDIRSGE